VNEWTAGILKKTQTYPMIKGTIKSRIKKYMMLALAPLKSSPVLVVVDGVFLKEKSPLKSSLEAIVFFL
jgi:hypothetical protein